jgi:RNA methyltransferase, RsmE family
MTRRRWIADEFSGDTAALTGDHAGHLVRVLRTRVGQEFDVVAGSAVRRGKVTSITESRVEFELGEAVPGDAARNVTLLLAVFKFDRMEWAIEKCTELGISKIIPIIARRTEAHLSSAAPKRVDRWRRVALQASEQSRRVRPPEITEPIKLGEAVSFLGDLRILLAESENQTMLRSVLAANDRKMKSCWRSAPKAAGRRTNCSCSAMKAGSPHRWAQRSFGPKRPRSRQSRSQCYSRLSHSSFYAQPSSCLQSDMLSRNAVSEGQLPAYSIHS